MNYGRVNDLFAHLCEIDSYDLAHARLHLSKAPISVFGAFHKHAWLQNMMRHYISPSTSEPSLHAEGNLDLPALITARICHDVISPLGAIGNGVELLEMAQDLLGPEIGLVRDSIQQAQARIRLFRIAFGPLRAEQMIGTEELTGLLRAYAIQARFELDWVPVQSQPKTTVRLALLSLLCVETALPYGGRVVLTQDGQSLTLAARTERPNLESALWHALCTETDWPDDLRAARVQFPLLRQAIQAQGASLDLDLAEHGLDLRITAVGREEFV